MRGRPEISRVGINPNLSLEDEVVENLLKQTHFLNMEIKLIKEKQKEQRGQGIMGLLSKDQQPVVTHAITSQAKYAQMKQQLISMVNMAEAEHLRLTDENFAVKAQREYVEALAKKAEQANYEHKVYVDKVLAELRDRLLDQQKKLKESREEQKRAQDSITKVREEYHDCTTKAATKELFKQISSALEGEVQSLKEKHLATNSEEVASLGSRLKEAETLFQADPSFQALKAENESLTEKYAKSAKDLFDTQYRVKEMEELKKLSLRNREVESELRKQASEEADRLKRRVADRKADMAAKIKEGITGLEAVEEVRLAKGRVMRKDKDISDLKKRCEVAEANFRKLRDEVDRLNRSWERQKELNGKLEGALESCQSTFAGESAKLRELELEFEEGQSALSSDEQSLREVRRRLEDLEEKAAYLGAKEEFLQREIKIDDGIKNVKIEQLQGLVYSNSGLNETISNLMKKWDEIIKFSREPPL